MLLWPTHCWCWVLCTWEGPLLAIRPCARLWGFHLAGAGVKSKGEGGLPPLKRGGWMPGGPKQTGGKQGLCWKQECQEPNLTQDS